MNCRHCSAELRHTFLDLGYAPPSNAYLKASDLNEPERYYPLRLKVCAQCWLVQTEDFACASELFSDEYAYFSSTSSSWLRHAAQYSEQIIRRLSLNRESFVIEIAANDGYLLRNFVDAGIPCVGIEPTASTAAAAEKIGIPVIREFFGETMGKRLADSGMTADLIIGNNVFAHVPGINDFARGLKAVLKPGGTITLEFPHLMQLIQHSQFDTVYHEHFSYLSLLSVARILRTAGLRISDVEELSTHGGSLRVHACHDGDLRKGSPMVQVILNRELQFGLNDLSVYLEFQKRIDEIKHGLMTFLIERKRAGCSVGGYGAAAKGNTLLNYAGIKPDLLPFVCDAAPSKQWRYLPGSHIPVLPPAALKEHKPGFVLILPWNIADEIRADHAYIREWGGRFVTAVPEIQVV
jgi:SAM-dependent methyltransferase